MNFFPVLYNLFEALIEFASTLWDWLFAVHSVGLKLPVLGIDWTFEFSTFGILLGGGFVVLIGLALVKYFVPTA